MLSKVSFHDTHAEIRPPKGNEIHLRYNSVSEMEIDGEKVKLGFLDSPRRKTFNIGSDNILMLIQRVKLAKSKAKEASHAD